LVEKAHEQFPSGDVANVAAQLCLVYKVISCLAVAKSLVLLIRNIYLTSEHHLIIRLSTLFNKPLLLLHLGLVYGYLLMYIVRFIYNRSFICMYNSNNCRAYKSEKDRLENSKLIKNENPKYE